MSLQTETKLCRDWSCQECGSGWLEEEGSHHDIEGHSDFWCDDCKARRRFAWRVREVSDPDEELSPASAYCWYCKELQPYCEEQTNYSHPVCPSCLKALEGLQ